MRQLPAAILALACAALPGLALPTVAPLSAAAATSDAQPADAAASAEVDTTAAPRVRIVDVAEPVLQPGEDLAVSVEVTNVSGNPLHVSSFELFAQASTAISETSVYRWMEDVTPAHWIATAPEDATVAPGETLKKNLTFSEAELPWPTEEFTWGPRGIEIAVADAGNELASDRTMIVAAPSVDITPYPAAAVVPITDPGLTGREPINTLLEGVPDERPADVSAQVARWDVPGVSLAVDQTLPAKPRHAATLALPSYDADIAALAELGLEAKAREWGAGAVYLPVGSPSEAAIDLAQDLGMTVLIPDSSYAPLSILTYTPSAVTSYRGETVLATNSIVSGVLDGSLTVGVKDTLALDDLDIRQVSVALSAVHHRQRPNDPRPYVMAVPRDADPAAEAAVKAILGAPWVKPGSVSSFLNRDPDSVERFLTDVPGDSAGALSDDDVKRINSALGAFGAVASIFDDADAKTSAAAKASAAMYSVAWRSNPSGRNAQIAAIAPTNEQLEAIFVTTSSTINLIAESSALPIQVTNRFDQSATVTVHLDVPDIRLRAPEPVEVTLPASATSTVSVPVEAHGSGNLDVDVTVTNKAGIHVGASDVLRVRVRADWENVGTVIVAGLVGVVFLIGLVKSIRNGRRSDPIQPDDFVAASKHT